MHFIQRKQFIYSYITKPLKRWLYPIIGNPDYYKLKIIYINRMIVLIIQGQLFVLYLLQTMPKFKYIEIAVIAENYCVKL